MSRAELARAMPWRENEGKANETCEDRGMCELVRCALFAVRAALSSGVARTQCNSEM